MTNNLTKKATRGILWSGVSQFSSQLFRFAVTIILARLLFPEDFGLIGMAAIFIGVATTVNELGLSAAIIQRKEITESHLSTSFWISVLMGITLCILTIIASPFVADFFQESLIEPMLFTLSFVFVIGSFAVVPEAILAKNLNFKKIAIAEIGSEVISGIVAVFLALSGFGVWSLVWRMLLGQFILVILLGVIYPWRPSMIFSFKSFNELFGFSINVTGSRVLNYAQANVDYLIIGKLLGTLSLGYYTMAYQLITFPLRRISWVITRVTFPAFSLIQENDEKLRKGYLTVVRYVSLVTFPMIAGLFMVSPEFVVLALGEKWSPIILPLQILCIAGIVRSIATTVGSILLPRGRADIEFKWNLITLILLTTGILIGVPYGIVGVAIAVTVIAVFMYTIVQIIANRLIDLSCISYLKALYPATFSSIIMIISIGIFRGVALGIYKSTDIFVLIGSIIIGTITYVIVLRLMYYDVIIELKSLIFEAIKPNSTKVQINKNGIWEE